MTLDDAQDTRNQRTARDPQTYAVLGAAMEVHRVLGRGFLEPVYQHALAAEFELRGIPFAREAPLPITYKERLLGCSYRVDFVCFDGLLVELKALATLTNVEIAIVLNYLKASGLERALLINFGAVNLEHKRLVWSNAGSGNRKAIDPQIYTD